MKWTRTTTVQKNIFGNFVEFLTKPQLDKTNWHIFSSTKRFYSVLYYILLVRTFQFFSYRRLTLLIWAISLTNLCCGFLLVIIFLLSESSCGASYLSLAPENITNISATSNKINNPNLLCSMFMRLGPFLFISHLVLFVEYAILFKFTRGKISFILNQWIRN